MYGKFLFLNSVKSNFIIKLRFKSKIDIWTL